MIDIDELIKESMKEENKNFLRSYRNLKAKIMYYKTSKECKEFTDEDFIRITTKYCKELKEAIQTFLEAGRMELAADYIVELDILEKLLPEEATDNEIKSYIKDLMDKNKIENIPKNEMGKYIKECKSKFPSNDGKSISNLVKSFVL